MNENIINKLEKLIDNQQIRSKSKIIEKLDKSLLDSLEKKFLEIEAMKFLNNSDDIVELEKLLSELNQEIHIIL